MTHQCLPLFSYLKGLRKTVLMQANQISEMDSIISNHTTMYVGLVK